MKHAKNKPLAKRAVAVVTAVAACVALTAGGTLAYFSASERAHNVITSGGVGIELLEWSLDEQGNRVPFEDVEGVMPGQSVDKIVEVRNDGQAPAWVRVKAEVSAELANVPEGEAPALLSDVVKIDYDEDAWTLEGGWWHYGRPLPAGEVTTPLFQHVAFACAEMGNP